MTARPQKRSRRGPRFSERAFHRWLRVHLATSSHLPLPLGDDAAGLRFPAKQVLLLTSDALVEGTHFLEASPPRTVGEAAVNASLSDLAAKGGTPRAILIDLLLPARSAPTWARAVVLGASRAAQRAGCEVVGGDTKAAHQRVVVGIAIGEGDPRHLAPRTSARVGDALVVTGAVGAGGAVFREYRRQRGPRKRQALAELLEITPRLREGRILSRYAHAMLDTSDGLADSVRILSEASGVRTVVDAARVPWTPRLATDTDRERFGFYGGDYELLAALPVDSVEPARSALAAVGCPLSDIGRVEKGHGSWLNEVGHLRPMPEAGWDPLAA